MTIDAHQHFWRIARGDYFWMDDGTAPIRRDLLPADLEPLARAGGVEGSVLVQAAPTVEETLFLEELAHDDPFIRAVVGWIDLEGDIDGQLDRIAHPKLRGLRPMLQDIPETGWIARPEIRAALSRIAARGLRLDALITPRHFGEIDALARDLPDLPIVIDHCAKPRFTKGDAGPEWRDGIAALARHPQVTCKLSGLANEYGAGWSAETLRPVFEHVMETFGPERTMWGSDWPVLDLAGDYSGWLAAARALASDLGEAEREALFRGTAIRFYDL